MPAQLGDRFILRMVRMQETWLNAQRKYKVKGKHVKLTWNMPNGIS